VLEREQRDRGERVFLSTVDNDSVPYLPDGKGAIVKYTPEQINELAGILSEVRKTLGEFEDSEDIGFGQALIVVENRMVELLKADPLFDHEAFRDVAQPYPDPCLCGAAMRNGVCSVPGCVCGVRQ
jgi:hypothetical protein